jgi:hypothetical protein
VLLSYADVDWMDAVGWTTRLYDEIQISTLRSTVVQSNTDLTVVRSKDLDLVWSAVYVTFGQKSPVRL